MLANNSLKIKTTINLSYNRFNINNLIFTCSNESKIIESNKIIDIIKPPSIIPKQFRFSIINIPKFTQVLIVDNEASLFSVNAYQDLLVESNINLLITASGEYLEYIKKFYKNIYTQDVKYQYIFFSNKFYKNFPISSIDVNKCYILNSEYDMKKRFNCFYINGKKDEVNLGMEEYEYQKFSNNSITWFLSKIINNLHKHVSPNIIICTDNIEYVRDSRFIFLDNESINYFNLYFNWFNFTYSNFNIQLSEFILLVIGFYFSKISNYMNIFIDSYISNKTDETIGLKKDKFLTGIQIRDRNLGDFFDYLKLVLNKFGDIKVSIERKTEITDLILINGYNKELKINNKLIRRLDYEVNNIEIIKMSYPYRNIWIFNSIKEYKQLENTLDKFPKENLKITDNNIEFYRIDNKPSNNNYRNISLKEYVLNFRELSNSSITEIYSKIRLYNNRIIITVLIDIDNNFTYFKHYYNKLGYKIIFLNLFDLDKETIETDNDNLILNLDNFTFDDKIGVFIKPNFYINSLDKSISNYKMFESNYFKDIGKKGIYKGIYDYSDGTSFNEIYTVKLDINILQRIKLNKFYNSILNNEYVGLFNS